MTNLYYRTIAVALSDEWEFDVDATYDIRVSYHDTAPTLPAPKAGETAITEMVMLVESPVDFSIMGLQYGDLVTIIAQLRSYDFDYTSIFKRFHASPSPLLGKLGDHNLITTFKTLQDARVNN